ncbi:hypothetical protein E2320_016513, partial [Naja naja]
MNMYEPNGTKNLIFYASFFSLPFFPQHRRHVAPNNLHVKTRSHVYPRAGDVMERRIVQMALMNHQIYVDPHNGSDSFYFPGPHSKVSRCHPNEYNCLGTELCIPMTKLCNGERDCIDGADEGPHCR